MSKNIVICSDGTGNTTVKGRGTNVFKLYEMIDLHDSGQKQIAIYDDGVGTESLKVFKLLGGAFGWGLSRNVRQLYAELVRVYEPDDKIFLFGFSRGAFTVRSLAGFISSIGVLKNGNYKNNAELEQAAKHAYWVYRRSKRALLEYLFCVTLGRFFRFCGSDGIEEFRKQNPAHGANQIKDGEGPIALIGVWDTVSAVGFPVLGVADAFNRLIYRFKFPDYRLNEKIGKACHALAIDDQRRTFHPLMWNEQGETGRIEQVWFAGVHSNVGGGFPKQGISLVSLDWMMQKAHETGLKFIENDWSIIRSRQNVCGKLYDSRAGLAVYYRYAQRDIAKICREHHTSVKIHDSVIFRIMHNTEGYAPGNIPKVFESVATRGAPLTPENFNQLLEQELPDKNSPLELATVLEFLRKHANLLFVALTLFALYLMLKSEFQQHGVAKTLSDIVTGKVTMKFAKDLFLEPWIIGVMVLMWIFGEFLKRKSENIFSSFWTKIRRMSGST